MYVCRYGIFMVKNSMPIIQLFIIMNEIFFFKTVLVLNDNNVFDMYVFFTLTKFVGNIIIFTM